MNRIDKLTEDFRYKYDRFFIGCDAAEEEGLWDKEENGEMDGFYQNDLVSVIIRLIAADGVISDKETEYLNKTFGFDYTTRPLKAASPCSGASTKSWQTPTRNCSVLSATSSSSAITTSLPRR